MVLRVAHERRPRRHRQPTHPFARRHLTHREVKKKNFSN
jgi:hypothetical protein